MNDYIIYGILAQGFFAARLLVQWIASNDYVIYGIGLLAQGLFAARLLVQWIASERKKTVQSPVLFWQLSMVGSITLFLYGWLRHDFAIILGQLISYYIYIWNLNAKESWTKIPAVMRLTFFTVPIIAITYFVFDWHDTVERLFRQENIPVSLIVYGVIGQFAFQLRFIYQWWYSRKKGESMLPVLFWIISLIGSALVVSYAIIRRDPVLMLGQVTGVIVYVRNLMIAYGSWKREKAFYNISLKSD